MLQGKWMLVAKKGVEAQLDAVSDADHDVENPQDNDHD